MHFYSPGGKGVRVSAIKPGSPADRAGLETGDEIARVGRTPVRDAGDFTAEVARTKPGAAVTLTGTDANHDLFDGERTPVVRRVLEGAARITVFHQSLGERVGAVVPDVKRRVVVVPQAVRLLTQWNDEFGIDFAEAPVPIDPVEKSNHSGFFTRLG